MTAKYAANTISGYNASPPSDDDTVAAANLVEWQKHLDKIGDPIKVLTESVDTAIQNELNRETVRKTASYSVQATDYNKVIEFSDITATSFCFLSFISNYPAGFQVTIRNLNGGYKLSLDASGSELIDSSGTISMGFGDCITVMINNAKSGWLIIERSAIYNSPVRATLNSNQAISLNSLTKVAYDVADIDLFGHFDVSNSYWVPPGANVVRITAQTSWSSLVAGDHLYMYIYLSSNILLRSEIYATGTEETQVMEYVGGFTQGQEIHISVLNATRGTSSIVGDPLKTFVQIDSLGAYLA